MLSQATFASLVPVRNMDRAIKFYTEALGGKLQMRAEGEMKDFWASVKVGKAEVWLVQPQKWEKRELAYSTFVVKDIKVAVKELKGSGAKFQAAEKNNAKTKIDGPIAYETYGAAAFFKDSEGNLLMLWQGE